MHFLGIGFQFWPLGQQCPRLKWKPGAHAAFLTHVLPTGWKPGAQVFTHAAPTGWKPGGQFFTQKAPFQWKPNAQAFTQELPA